MNRNPLMELNSQQLQTLQNVMIERIQEETKKPDADFSMIAEWAELTNSIDTQRRHVWNDEKFGTYEAIADQYFDENDNLRDFAADDIPF